jgi:hypothetical protein
VSLPGKVVEAVSWKDNVLYGRTRDGDFRSDGVQWQRADADSDVFFGALSLRLTVGKGLAVTGVERFESGAWHATLYDYSNGRFAEDAVSAIQGDEHTLWALTPRGLEQLSLEGNRISQHALTLQGSLVSIRRDAGGRLCALDSDGGSRCHGSDENWFTLSGSDRRNPFFAPITGRLSNVVSWRREYHSDGDRWVLFTTAGDLDFREGKLATDFVSSTAATSEETAEVSGAGILRGSEVIPSPASAAVSLRVELGKRGLAARVNKATYLYDSRTHRWAVAAAGELDAPYIRFDGLHWTLAGANQVEPVIRGPSQSQRVILNNAGQFEFDAVRSVATRRSELWLAHDSGAEVWSLPNLERLEYATFPKSLTAQARLSVDSEERIWVTAGDSGPSLIAEPESRRFLVAPSNEDTEHRLGRSGLTWKSSHTLGLTVSALPGAVWVRSTLGAQMMPIPEEIISISGSEKFAWLLSRKQLRRLDLRNMSPFAALGTPSQTDSKVSFGILKSTQNRAK